ncbi:GNAT family N-acetyltransferase [Nakamurella sp. YIM 132087]|uniref:GNAT family N-acetyltransferase n=1 Tax=Nakamurella alba TaxID=2665158 RepID=A0A7K1FK96_9ACTN|nr:GNAT family N-acetyltransferase [Nakamurella alba]MTD14490.1 GNAT family N-acetyltransferase [Nakamurella alba]
MADTPEPERVALAVAERAGVEVRELHGMTEMHRAAAIFDEVWDIGPGGTEMQPGLLQALAHSGNYVVGAFDASGGMVAASAAFLSTGDAGLHSHITGALGVSKGVGGAIKWHQRAWCLQRGIGAVAWTYDPLISRNAWFNIRRLGARPVRYLVDFYGEMPDAINAGQPTDRMLAVWELLSSPALAAAAAAASGAAAPGPAGHPEIRQALAVGPDGRPVIDREALAQDQRVTAAMPDDVETLRKTDPRSALDWRLAQREVLTTLLDAGARIVDQLPGRGYLLHRTAGAGTEES